MSFDESAIASRNVLPRELCRNCAPMCIVQVQNYQIKWDITEVVFLWYPAVLVSNECLIASLYLFVVLLAESSWESFGGEIK